MSHKNKRVVLKRMSKLIKFILPIFLLIFYFALISEANAVPSFARQTGQNCVACHTSFPELTPFGREFKLNGYTLGEAKMTPFALMIQASNTYLKKNTNGDGTKNMVKEGDPQLDQFSIFAAGKVNDHLGGFIQWTYANNDNGHGGTVGHSALDNTDIRLIDNYTIAGKNLLVGINLNNNPTVQDVWNTTPAWGYPYYSSPWAPAPSASTKIEDMGSPVAGLGGYFWWDRHLYGELSLYGDASHVFHVLGSGTSTQDLTRLSGRNNPYWRLAWNEEFGPHSLMLGTFGMQSDIYPDPTIRSGPTDRYTDIAIDTQYQYISDPSIFTVQSSFIHEKKTLNASVGSSADNLKDTLNTFKIKASYLYDRTYGATLGYFKTTGSSDSSLYNDGSYLSSKPDYEGYTAQLDYSYQPNIRVGLIYTGYLKWAGNTSNYLDSSVTGYTRNPSNNNSLFLNLWFAY